MTLRSQTEIRREMADLIADAVGEADDERRTALLVLADHWADILRRRQQRAAELYAED